MGPNISEKFVLGGTNFRGVQIKRDKHVCKFEMYVFLHIRLGYESLDAQILCDLSSFHFSHPHFHLPLFLSTPLSPNGVVKVGHTGSCAPATRGYAPPVLVLISAKTILNLAINVYKKP